MGKISTVTSPIETSSEYYAVIFDDFYAVQRHNMRGAVDVGELTDTQKDRFSDEFYWHYKEGKQVGLVSKQKHSTISDTDKKNQQYETEILYFPLPEMSLPGVSKCIQYSGLNAKLQRQRINDLLNQKNIPDDMQMARSTAVFVANRIRTLDGYGHKNVKEEPMGTVRRAKKSRNRGDGSTIQKVCKNICDFNDSTVKLKISEWLRKHETKLQGDKKFVCDWLEEIMDGKDWQDIASNSKYNTYKEQKKKQKKSKYTRYFPEHVRSQTTALLRKIMKGTSVKTR